MPLDQQYQYCPNKINHDHECKASRILWHSIYATTYQETDNKFLMCVALKKKHLLPTMNYYYNYSLNLMRLIWAVFRLGYVHSSDSPNNTWRLYYCLLTGDRYFLYLTLDYNWLLPGIGLKSLHLCIQLLN